MDARPHLENRFGLTLYRVPPESADDFLAWQRRAAEVFREHALSWSLWRSRKEPDAWVEFGPRFRERAELEHVANALDSAGILERLARFEVDPMSLPATEGPAVPDGDSETPEHKATFEV